MMLSPDKNHSFNRVAYLAVMISLSAVFGYFEQLIPITAFGIPGIKPGLANTVSLIALFVWGPGYAYFIMICRILLLGFMFTNMYSVIYSLAGGILSMSVMWFLKKTGAFKIAGISAAGGAAHNIGQLIVAAVTLNELDLKFYVPLLTVSGMIFGTVTGILACMLIERLNAYLKNTAAW